MKPYDGRHIIYGVVLYLCLLFIVPTVVSLFIFPAPGVVRLVVLVLGAAAVIYLLDRISRPRR